MHIVLMLLSLRMRVLHGVFHSSMGSLAWDKRHEFWSLLRRLRQNWEGPWLVCGDFNEVLFQHEHLGIRSRTESQMDQFKDCLLHCGRVDLAFSGPVYTWSNRQEDESVVRVRLDQAVANGAFSTAFDDCYVENIITTTSDHFAILIRLQNLGGAAHRSVVQTGFRYEAA